MIDLTFATHPTTVDNKRGLATGWPPGAFSPTGREQARAVGVRYRDAVNLVVSSDLARAAETTALAFSGSPVPRFIDGRLRECDYGRHNGHRASEVHAARLAHLDDPHPRGESFQDVVGRVEGFLRDLARRWDSTRVLIVGHSATRYALDNLLRGEDLAAALSTRGEWQPGWR